MSIPQSDGSGRGFSANPYPRAVSNGKFEAVYDSSDKLIGYRHRKSQVWCRLTKNGFRMLPKGQQE